MSNIFEFQDNEFTLDPVWSYSRKYGKEKTCIVIDNGSHSCRAGWATDSQPKLVFRNLVAKQRGKKETDISNVYFGNDIVDLEDSKWNIRTQFDMDVVTHFDTQEYAFDYLFSHLGINTEDSVNHPVCITEAVCIPNLLRHHMSEILFECYNVPKVIYGIDSLFSVNYNMPNMKYGILISCGYQTSHVLPIIDGKCDASNSRRLNLGGLNMMIYLRRLLQLKYPNQTSVLNLSRAQELLMGHTYMAVDYFEELQKWQNSDFKEQDMLCIQLPVLNTTTEKDLELRKIQARRLKDINQKKREEKLKVEQEQLAKYEEISELEAYNPSAFKERLKQEGMESENDLLSAIKELKEKIEDRREKGLKYFEELNDGNSSMLASEFTSVGEVEKVISSLEDEKLALLDKRRSRASRRQALNKRKSYASKERMRILSQLAKGGSSSVKLNKEDTFGMKDEDWDVYKYINKDGSDSEDEQDQERLNEIEQLLSQNQLLVNKLMIGQGQKYQYLSFDTEKIRVPECLYQPSLMGIDQEGLAGMIGYVLKSYDSDVQDKMIKHIFITGGPSQFHGFKERLTVELTAMLPFQSKFNIFEAKDCVLDSWYGAADMIRKCADIANISIDATDYTEQSEGYFKEHSCSNLFVNLNP